MKQGVKNATASLVAIVTGLLVGFIILLISNAQNAVPGLAVILKGGFNGGMKGIGQVLYYATPIIMTGLSVGFAFKTGLFNIGATGQFMVGAFVSVYVGYTWTWLPGWTHWVVAMLLGMLAGGLWGLLPGFFKAKLNVNEVISSIMMNYIGMYLTNYLIKNSAVLDTAKNETFAVAANAAIPKAGLNNVFYNLKGRYMDASSVNAGILIAILLAIVLYVLLNKTTFGYELKACGYNKDASRYAGINQDTAIILSMVIAGMMAGAGGALTFLAPANGRHIQVLDVLAAEGFNGIPVALLGLSNPIGIIFAGLFVAYITVGGTYLQSLKYMPEIIDIIIAMVIYFSAFSLLVKAVFDRVGRKRHAMRDGREGRA